MSSFLLWLLLCSFLCVERKCVCNACMCILKGKLVSVCLFPSFSFFHGILISFYSLSPAHSTITQTCSHTTHTTMFPQNVSTKLSHKQAIRISLLNLQLLFVFSFQSRKWLAYLFSIRCALCSTSLSATLATFSLLNPHKHPSCFCASNRRILNSYISLQVWALLSLCTKQQQETTLLLPFF